MGRIGVKPEQVLTLLEEIKSLVHIDIEGIYSHLSSADAENDEYTLMQIRLFNELLDKVSNKGMGFRIRHLANSAATFRFPQAFFDLVRPGIMLYGLYPEANVLNSIDLRPAMALRSRISYIKNVPAGTAIGYERTFITSRSMKIATVPLGYGNGFSRLFSNRGKVSVRGHSVPIIGNICMNAFMVDVSDIDIVQPWDEVEIFGSEISIHEVARTMGTIVQEIASTLGRINPRCYVGNR
jgi:alanine racemase